MDTLAELENAIGQCMIRDRVRLRRRLKEIQRKTSNPGAALEQLAKQIEVSCQQVQQRQADIPPPNYPAELPVVEKRASIVEAIAKHQVIILCGETGSGKSTQLPKLCLEAGRGIYGLIGHTQPRRIAARSVAERIAGELDSELGQWIGYQVRFHQKINPRSYVKLMTDGILLAEIQRDRFLNQYDTLIIDEAHERSINIDFLLGYLKRLLARRPELKLIVTSATLEPERLSRHFDDAPILEVSGRLYPVEVRYRPIEEGEPNEALVEAVDELSRHGPGDMLVFLSGERAIREAARALHGHHPPSTEVVPLFARQSQPEQRRIFQPHRGRRIILATNVAETSLTVPDIHYVIDSGLARVSRYSYRSKIQHLPIEKISQASANQRKGRCGRVSAGVCIRLYDQEDFEQRPAFTEPEIRRTNLASVILQMNALQLGSIESFPFVDPPQPKQIKDGYQLLEEIGAFKQGRSTTLARQLVKLPVDPRLGRFVIAANRYHCLSEALIIASALSIQDPRERPADKQSQADAAHQAFVDKDSDFVSLLKLWDFYSQQRRHLSKSKLRKLCQQNFLAYNRMEEWRDLHNQLTESALQQNLSRNNEPASYSELHTALLSGFVTQVGVLDEQKQYHGVRNRRFRIFPGSALAGRSPKWIMAAALIETSQVFAHYVARIDPRWIETVGRHLLKYEYGDPQWDDRRAAARAAEHISLFGLPLNLGRHVDYGRIDPVHARELFIREGLVHGRLKTKAAFVTHNQSIIDDIRAEEAKSRRPDILVDEEALFQRYDESIPAEVYSGAFFEKWYARASQQDPDLLKLDAASLTRSDADKVDKHRFPDSIAIGDNTVRLQYHFEPGSERDGVTALVPQPLLPYLDPVRFEWLVPGLLEEKITFLIKALPKSFRRHVVPAPDYARACCEALDDHNQPLVNALSRKLGAMTGIDLPLSAWEQAELPEHLKMKFAVIDAAGEVLARGHDLSQLQRHWKAAPSGVSVGEWALERDNVTCWNFDELPLVVHREERGLRLQGYPALTATPAGVAIRVYQHRDKADAAMVLGLARLYQTTLKTQCKFLRKNFPHIQQSCMLYRSIGDCAALTQDLLDVSFVRAFRTDTEVVRNERAFNAQLAQHKNELVTIANETAELCFTILQRHHRIRSALNDASLPPSLREDIDSQLNCLVYPNFFPQTDYTRLCHYPRYLQAVEKRLERFKRNPERDKSLQDKLHPYWQRARRVCDRADDADKPNEQAVAFRWMVEEWRVSLFAQELKTPISVSEKRLDELYRRLDA